MITTIINKEKQELVLAKMLSLGYITQEEYDEAVNYPLTFSKDTAATKKEEIITYGRKQPHISDI